MAAPGRVRARRFSADPCCTSAISLTALAMASQMACSSLAAARGDVVPSCGSPAAASAALDAGVTTVGGPGPPRISVDRFRRRKKDVRRTSPCTGCVAAGGALTPLASPEVPGARFRPTARMLS